MEEFLDQIRNDHHNFDKGQISDHVPGEPFDFFHDWYKQAFEKGEREANAMVLSTVDGEGKPSSRILYLKELNTQGFVFYTNYLSRKGREMNENKHAALLFFWPGLERQVRIEGKIEKVPAEMSDAYFASRPRGSQLGAWASYQSQQLENRSELEERIEKLAAQFPAEVPRPPHWGGYILVPEYFEFWQGRPSRLHDRIIYQQDKTGRWDIHRLNP
ncbi:MAG: pdxH [Crocinitomicaceae bacterium]|jgi:pyridoxamine 5'-phosphate oxidase|nr:pdxH [Crocinitomicaceae bacterium]